LWRRACEAIETLFRLVSDPDGRLFQLTGPDQMFSRYHGLIVQATKRMSDNWQGTFSVVFSESPGRIGSSLMSPTASQIGTAATFGQNPNDFVNTEGRLIADRPVIAKAQFVVNLPWRFLVGANALWLPFHLSRGANVQILQRSGRHRRNGPRLRNGRRRFQGCFAQAMVHGI